MRQLAGVLAVFVLLGAVLWTLRRAGRLTGVTLPSGRKRALSSVDRLVLSPQHTLHLVRMGDREMIVATHPQGCTVLGERPVEEVRT
ncbi:MAG: flagellar biosynthetic protein FliO [Bryobacteraceae bacterium]